MIHVQFESIHPFLDGNGRIGRLLITLLFHERGLLKETLLYLSLFIMTQRPLYYSFLNRMRTHGDWESWLEYFLDGIYESAGHATRTAVALQELCLTTIRTDWKSGSTCVFCTAGIWGIPGTKFSRSTRCGKAYRTIGTYSKKSDPESCGSLDIAKEVTGKVQNQIFVHRECINTLIRGGKLEFE